MQVKRAQTSASVRSGGTQALPATVRPSSTQVGAEAGQADAALALDLIASSATTQPVETVLAVLSARRGGASINAAAKASGINFRTAQRIVKAAAEHHGERQLTVVG